MREHERINRSSWNETADDYQRINASQIRGQAFSGDITWGVWGIPESRLGVLGDVSGKDVLELGCGGGQWSTALARRGARPIGLDLSERQLEHARRLMGETGISFPLVQASAEQIPFAEACFDIVFADYGAFTFADPSRTVPEAARVLRRGGLLAFTHASPIEAIAAPAGADHASDRLDQRLLRPRSAGGAGRRRRVQPDLRRLDRGLPRVSARARGSDRAPARSRCRQHVPGRRRSRLVPPMAL